MSEPEWRRLNRANWDERVAVHLAPESDYDMAGLRAGNYLLHAIEEAELGPIARLRLLHLQCHFGIDTLALAQKGARVTGLDFSAPAIEAAQNLAAELGIDADFVQADIYDARAVLQGEFDRIFVTWGTIVWLPDIRRWAQVIASLLAPGGVFYFADMHPAAMVFDDAAADAKTLDAKTLDAKTGRDGFPGRLIPYFQQGELPFDNVVDYANPVAKLSNSRTLEFMHPLASVVQALIDAGLVITMLHEHDAVAWKAFACLVEVPGRLYGFPDRPWLPLSYSLKAERRSA